MSKKHPNKCTTGTKTRCSYLNVIQPKAYGDGKPEILGFPHYPQRRCSYTHED